MDDILKTAITVIITIFVGGIGYLIRDKIEKDKKKLNIINRERRRFYQNFINLIMPLLLEAGEVIDSVDDEENDKTMKHLLKFYKKCLIYASPRVINAFSELIKILKLNKSDKMRINELLSVTKVVIEIRKDLGLKNNNLGKNGIVLLKLFLEDSELKKL